MRSILRFKTLTRCAVGSRLGHPSQWLPSGSEGDIAYRGPGHMLGHLGQPELTAELFIADGFSPSGDLGVMDTDGYVRVPAGRKTSSFEVA